MSLLAVQGGATGSGTVTLLAPATNTDRTLTLPDVTGTVLTTATAGVPVNGPAFSAYNSADQSITTATWTKLAANTEEFDTNSCFDNATNYRFTPTVAGYYQVDGKLAVYATVATASLQIGIYKNGTLAKRGSFNSNPAGIPDVGVVVSSIMYLNGSTDYIELYGLCAFTGTNTFSGGGTYSYFQAAMVRSAV
tara:strand:+ start:263 stop:841 length:579 start_codon:yes stop_codon:yes gene_type:complete